MDALREAYTKVDEWALALSRLEYALVIGIITTCASLAVQLVIGNLDPVFATVLGVTLTVLYYLGDPNNTEEIDD